MGRATRQGAEAGWFRPGSVAHSWKNLRHFVQPPFSDEKNEVPWKELAQTGARPIGFPCPECQTPVGWEWSIVRDEMECRYCDLTFTPTAVLWTLGAGCCQ